MNHRNRLLAEIILEGVAILALTVFIIISIVTAVRKEKDQVICDSTGHPGNVYIDNFGPTVYLWDDTFTREVEKALEEYIFVPGAEHLPVILTLLPYSPLQRDSLQDYVLKSIRAYEEDAPKRAKKARAKEDN